MIERLKEIRLKFNKTQNEMAEIIGISRSTYTGIEKGKATLTERNKMLIIDKLNINPIWFETGEGEMLKSNFIQSDVRNVDTQTMNGIQIPFIPIHAIALFIESFYNLSSHHQYNTYHITPRPGESLNPSEYIVFEIEGNSMSPTIKPNSLILTKLIPEKQWEYAEGVVVVIYGKSLILKRIKKNDLFGNNQILLSSDNPNHGDIEIERSQIQAIYKAKRIISEDII